MDTIKAEKYDGVIPGRIWASDFTFNNNMQEPLAFLDNECKLKIYPQKKDNVILQTNFRTNLETLEAFDEGIDLKIIKEDDGYTLSYKDVKGTLKKHKYETYLDAVEDYTRIARGENP